MKTLRAYLLSLMLAVLPAAALAQSSPGLSTGQVPTAGQWNSFFAAKQDFLGFTPINPSSVNANAPITASTGSGVLTIGTSVVAPGHVLGNGTGGSIPAADSTLTTVLDQMGCGTQNTVLYRNATVWSCSKDPILGVGGASTGSLTFGGATSGTLTVQPSAAAGNYTLTLPPNGGTNNFVLTTNGSGTTSWAAAGTGTVTSVTCGGSLTGGTITTTGTCAVNTGTSGATVPLLNGANTWSGKQTFGALSSYSSAAYASTTAGDIEYDGTAFANLPAASDRGIVPSMHFISLSADQTGSNATGAQTFFPGGGVTQYTAPATTSYMFDGTFYMARTAGTTSHTITVSIGGTATLSSINWIQECTSTTGNAFASFTMARFDAANVGGTACTAASIIATENNVIRVSGVMRVNGTGTIIPQFAYSSAPGGAPTIKANSYFRLYPIGSNTVLNVGNNS